MAEQNLDRLKIILVGTSHPGNMGASARAMKAMGIRDLVLVNPKVEPNAEAYALSAGADDVLYNATVSDSLSDALSNCSLVIGTTARERSLQWPVITPHQAGLEVCAALPSQPTALVFGREQSGLSNEEVEQCHKLIRIPTAADFSSLNLAQAVQVCTYEVRRALVEQDESEQEDGRQSGQQGGQGGRKAKENSGSYADDPPASNDAVLLLFEHLKSVMTQIGYLYPDNPRLLPQRVRRLLNKAELSVTETQICRGFLKAIEGRIETKEK